jgi:hypothetical protein
MGAAITGYENSLNLERLLIQSATAGHRTSRKMQSRVEEQVRNVAVDGWKEGGHVTHRCPRRLARRCPSVRHARDEGI